MGGQDLGGFSDFFSSLFGDMMMGQSGNRKSRIDFGGFLYHERVATLADAARKAGLMF